MEGVQVRRNPKNKFVVFELHYTANPAKRGAEFKEAMASAMPRSQYLREYELQWDTFSGYPVYPDWDRKRHGFQRSYEPEAGLPLLRGWDFGLTPACVVGQLQGDQLIIFREFVETNMGADRFSDLVLRECDLLWPNWRDRSRNWRDFIDPSGEFRKDTDEGTCAKILDSKGLSCVSGAIAWEERRQSVENRLISAGRMGWFLQVDLEQCPLLTKGFEGGYRYPEKSAEIEPHKIRPLKDEHSHVHDALQMLTSRLTMVRNTRRSGVKIPVPSYKFGA